MGLALANPFFYKGWWEYWMADFTLIVGVDTTVSYENMRKEINAIVRLINKTP